VLRLGGYPAAVDRQLRDLAAVMVSHGGVPLTVAESAWDDMARMRRLAAERQVLLKAAAPIVHASALVELLERQLSELKPLVWSHAGNGIAYAACDAPVGANALVQLRAQVAELGSNASLVIQRCPSGIKSGIDVWGDPGSSLALMRTLKAKLDPRNTLNPGRYVGGI
jgi:FAD/FMN-containing dehydrogenase